MMELAFFTILLNMNSFKSTEKETVFPQILGEVVWGKGISMLFLIN